MNNNSTSAPFVLVLLIFLLWIPSVLFGIRNLKQSGHSPHWMWFGIHPFFAPIVFLISLVLVRGKSQSLSSTNLRPSPPPLPPSVELSNPPPSPVATSARAKYDEGLRLLKSDDPEDKRAALKAFMDAANDPNCVEASLEVAGFFFRLDAPKHADVWRPYAERAFKVAPSNEEARYLMGAASVMDADRHSANNDWLEVYNSYKRAFELHPEDGVFSMLEIASRKADRQGDFADLCEDWLEEHPNDHAKRLSLGRASFRLALDSNDAVPGQEWIQPEFFRRARVAFQRYVRDLPDSPHGHFHLARVYLATGESKLAREQLKALLRLDAKKAKELESYFEDLGISAGDISSGVGPSALRERAQARFKEGMRLIEPDNTDREGFESIDADNFKKGVKMIEEAWHIDSSFIDPPLMLASLDHRIDPVKYCERILSLADAAMAIDPNNPEAKRMASLAYFTKAQALMDREEWKAAVDYFRRAHELEPFDAQALSVFRLAAVDADEHELFVGICESHLKSHPDDHQVHYTVARALLNWALKASTAPDATWLKDRLLKEAGDHLKEFLLTDPLQPDANYWLACALIMSRRYDEARQVLAKLSEIDPLKGKELEEQLKSAPHGIRFMEYSTEMSKGLEHAKDAARRAKQSEIHNEHFILALLDLEDNFHRNLARTKIDIQELEIRLRSRVGDYVGNDPKEDVRFGEDLTKTIEQAEWFRTQLGGDRVGSEHYLSAFINEKGGLSEYIADFIHEAVRESKSEKKE